MATLKQRKLARAIVENLDSKTHKTAGQLLEKVGYSPHLAKQPGRVIESEGVQEALEEYGFTEDNAKSVVSQILLNPRERSDTRLNAAKEVFKIKGSYAPEKSVSLNVRVGKPAEDKANEIIMRFLNGNSGNPTE